MRAQLLAYLYKKHRQKIINACKKKSTNFDLETVIEQGESQLGKLLNSPVQSLLFDFEIPKKLAPTHLHDLTFPSPLTFAAFQGDKNQLEMWLKMGIGGGCFKTILKAPRAGNKRPRIDEVIIENEPHLINAYGLPGKGVQAFCLEIKDSLLWSFNRPLGISIGGHHPEEYYEVFNTVNHCIKKNNMYIEVNISCPNTDDGKNMLKNPQLLEKLLKRMRDETESVIVVKLSPDQGENDLLIFSECIRLFKKTAINIGNTQFRSHQKLTRGGGGLSGPHLYKRTLEMVKLLANQGLPIIATGGIDSIEKVKELLQSGATLASLATGLIFDPYTIPKINKALCNK